VNDAAVGEDIQTNNLNLESSLMLYNRLTKIMNKVLIRLTVACAALLVIVGLMAVSSTARAQSYDLLLKGGHVIDPKNHINADRDVAIKDGKIALVATNIPSSEAKKVVDVSGLYVTPGIIDIHTHDFWGYDPRASYGGGYNAVQPDGFTFRAGVTTVVDAGSSGWITFPTFKNRVIDHTRVRVLAFLNIVSHGMVDHGGGWQQNERNFNPKMTAMMAERYPNIIVGVKTAHYRGGWRAADSAEKAANMAGIPIMVDFGGASPALSMKKLLFDVMTPGDIYTHCFAHLMHPGSSRGRQPVVNPYYKLKPFVKKAQKKGIVFDVGHGGGSFQFHTAIAAIKAGFEPNSISSDMHVGDINRGMLNMANLMSKFLNMGESLHDVIQQTTWHPAKEIHHTKLGNLSPGMPADIAVFSIQHGKFGFVDSYGAKMMGDKKLICQLTVKGGKIVYDLNGLANPLWKKVETKVPAYVMPDYNKVNRPPSAGHPTSTGTRTHY
jgi:dihydroorotase